MLSHPARGTILSIAAALAALAVSVSVQETTEQHLRKLYYLGDDRIMARDGRVAAKKVGASLETRAWFFSMKNTTGFVPESPSILEEMEAEAPGSPWTLVAESFVAGGVEKSIGLCEKTWEKDSLDHDFSRRHRSPLQHGNPPANGERRGRQAVSRISLSASKRIRLVREHPGRAGGGFEIPR